MNSGWSKQVQLQRTMNMAFAIRSFQAMLAGMDWQEIAALGIVAGTVAWLLRGLAASNKPGGGGRTGCAGCAPARSHDRAVSMVFRARKGQPGTVTLRMR
jgi:hypothetical protein